jgi:hypothetical protein
VPCTPQPPRRQDVCLPGVDGKEAGDGAVEGI